MAAAERPRALDLRSLVARLRRAGRLRSVRGRVSPRLQACALISKAEPAPILLEDIAGRRVLGNILPSREALAEALGVSPERFLPDLSALLSGKLSRPGAKTVLRDAVYGEEEVPRAAWGRLPFLTYYSSDGGPYLTAGVWIVKDPVNGVNLSYHRLMMTGPARGAVRVVENRGMDTAIRNNGGKADVAICIGAPMNVLFAAALSPGLGVDEMDLAARLGKVELARCKTVDLLVPADCEFVLEGRFTGERGPEGPFVDITGTIDGVRTQPVLELTRASGRRDALHYAIVPALSDHRTLMGVPKELDIHREVSRECPCLDVRITPGGASWLHAAVRIEKRAPDDGRKALSAAFRAHKSLKHCIVVDSDIDIADPVQVEWAVATRFQAGAGLVVMNGQPCSSLDPSAEHEPGRKASGSKMGIDATIPAGKDKALFMRLAA